VVSVPILVAAAVGMVGGKWERCSTDVVGIAKVPSTERTLFTGGGGIIVDQVFSVRRSKKDRGGARRSKNGNASLREF